MLKTEVKEALLLFTFALFMHEVLTNVTIALTLACVVLTFFRAGPSKLWRNILALGVLATYWFSYEKVIDPEVGLNFLVTVVVLKLLEKESERDRYMAFFGLLLVLSVGALFEQALSYVLFFTGAFLVLVRDFYRAQGQTTRLKDFCLLFLWILPLTFALFVFVPRAINPIPFNRGLSGKGEIGYTTGVNFSSLEELSGNDRPAFQAEVIREISQNALYWRGNTISLTDGWNWSVHVKDRTHSAEVVNDWPSGLGVHQAIRLFSKEEFFFSLDRPSAFRVRGKTIVPSGPGTLMHLPRNRAQSYEAVSLPGEGPRAISGGHKTYLQTKLPAEELEWIQENFKGERAEELAREMREYFWKEGLVYTLRPGLVAGLGEFMRTKKAGMCSHFASAVALIMRAKGVPARLVSGYMGGKYNHFGKFYLVSQNDAHVWAEVYEDGQWSRMDPTEWIAPDRARLGGEAFMSTLTGSVLSRLRIPGEALFHELRMWFGQWDFRFYRWIEQMDYQSQEALFSKIRFKRKWFYALAPLLLLVFSALYIWLLNTRSPLGPVSENQRLWALFLKKLQARGIVLALTSVGESRKHLEAIGHPERDIILELWDKLVEVSFSSERNCRELKIRIKKL